MRAQIDILAAEVPEAKIDSLLGWIGLGVAFDQAGLAKADAMRGRDGRIESFAFQPATDLRLTDAAVAEDQYLKICVWCNTQKKIISPCLYARQAIIVLTF